MACIAKLKVINSHLGEKEDEQEERARDEARTDGHGSETCEGGADGETGETHLGDGRVDDSLLAKLVQKAFRDLAGIEWESEEMRWRKRTLYAPL